jgi:hypothetical protein
MKKELSIEQVLAWRLAQAEADAPPAPRAARLLEMSRTWWERWPETFDRLIAQLGNVRANFGHAMVAEPRSRGYPVPTVVARTNVEISSLAEILYFNVNGSRIRLRFQVLPALAPAAPRLEITFVAVDQPSPLFVAPAVLAPGGEYRVDAEMPGALARAWAEIKVTDRMPFRFVLHEATPL